MEPILENRPDSDQGSAKMLAENAEEQKVHQTAELNTGVTRGRTLYRHPTEKLVGGVCGGLGEYLGLDPSLVRILWVVATLASGGGGLLAYLALWGLLPVGTSRGGQQQPPALELNERNLSRAATLLILFGGLWLLANLGILPWLWRSFWNGVATIFWPGLLIGVGYLLLRSVGKGKWEHGLAGVGSDLRARLNSNLPGRGELKAGLRNLQARIPLKRSRKDRLFMGVCGGIGQSLGLDPNLVRLLWAAFSIGSIGMGVLIYVGLGLLLPEEPLTSRPYPAEAQDVPIVDGSARYHA